MAERLKAAVLKTAERKFRGFESHPLRRSHRTDWRARGYRVSLFFLALPSAETAIARVAERVRQGGHTIPDHVIRRRFAAGNRNFEHAYRAAVDDWAVYDNTGSTPRLLEWGENP